MIRIQKIQRGAAALAAWAILTLGACGPSADIDREAPGVDAAPPEATAIEIDEGVVEEREAMPIDDQEEEEGEA